MDQDRRAATLLARPNRTPAENWRSSANCRFSDPNLFYPVGRGRSANRQIEEAKAVCHGCPSRAPCLAFAIATRQHRGVWGGTSPEERRRLARDRLRIVAS